MKTSNSRVPVFVYSKDEPSFAPVIYIERDAASSPSLGGTTYFPNAVAKRSTDFGPLRSAVDCQYVARHEYIAKAYGSYRARPFDFHAWVENVCSLTFNFDADADAVASMRIIDQLLIDGDDLLDDAISRICDAVAEYRAVLRDCVTAHKISEDSAKRVFLIVPLLKERNPRFHVDSTNGFFSVDVAAAGGRVMTMQVNDNGYVHFSYVGRGVRVFKLTGTAKFREFEDFQEFDRVLQML